MGRRAPRPPRYVQKLKPAAQHRKFELQSYFEGAEKTVLRFLSVLRGISSRPLRSKLETRRFAKNFNPQQCEHEKRENLVFLHPSP